MRRSQREVQEQLRALDIGLTADRYCQHCILDQLRALDIGLIADRYLHVDQLGNPGLDLGLSQLVHKGTSCRPWIFVSQLTDSQNGFVDQLQALVLGLSKLTRSQHVIVDQLLGPRQWILVSQLMVVNMHRGKLRALDLRFKADR